MTSTTTTREAHAFREGAAKLLEDDSAETVLYTSKLLEALQSSLQLQHSQLVRHKTQLQKQLYETEQLLHPPSKEESSTLDDDGAGDLIAFRPEVQARLDFLDLLESTQRRLRKQVSQASSSSSDWEVCLSRSCSSFVHALDQFLSQKQDKGVFQRKLPSWTRNQVKIFIQRDVFFLTFGFSFPCFDSGEDLTGVDWTRLDMCLQIVTRTSKASSVFHLFLLEIEPKVVEWIHSALMMDLTPPEFLHRVLTCVHPLAKSLPALQAIILRLCKEFSKSDGFLEYDHQAQLDFHHALKSANLLVVEGGGSSSST